MSGGGAVGRRDSVRHWKRGWEGMLDVCFDKPFRAHTKGSKVEQIII